MADHEELKVPKDRIAVELGLRNGARRTGHLFLAENEAHAFRHESVTDIMLDERTFLPVSMVDGDEWVFVNKSAIGYLAMGRLDHEDLRLFDQDVDVQVCLRDGSELSGSLLYSARTEQSRLIDFLNSDTPYVRLYGPDTIFIVDKHFIDSVAQLNNEGSE